MRVGARGVRLGVPSQHPGGWMHFPTTPQRLTLRLNAIYDEGELEASATCKEHLQVRSGGSRRAFRLRKRRDREANLAVTTACAARGECS